MIWKASETELLQSENDVLDYQFDYQYFLAADSDTIASVVVTSDPTVTITNISNTTTAVTFWIGLTGDGLVTVVITTTLGRTIERCVTAKIEECV